MRSPCASVKATIPAPIARPANATPAPMITFWSTIFKEEEDLDDRRTQGDDEATPGTAFLPPTQEVDEALAACARDVEGTKAEVKGKASRSSAAAAAAAPNPPGDRIVRAGWRWWWRELVRLGEGGSGERAAAFVRRWCGVIVVGLAEVLACIYMKIQASTWGERCGATSGLGEEGRRVGGASVASYETIFEASGVCSKG